MNLPSEIEKGPFSKEQLKTLDNLRSEISEAWDNQVVWRTWTEANFSVLDDIHFPTPAAKYHQAVREQLVFFENTVLLSYDYREKQIDLDEVQEKLQTTEGYEKRRLEVRRDRLIFELEGMKLQAKDRIRELQMWSEIKASLVASEEFDTQNKDTDELVALTIRFCREALLLEKSRNSDPGAVTNIIGQATTCLRECSRRGIMGTLPSECRTVQKRIGKL